MRILNEKAIELKQDAIKSGKDKDANATKTLSAYYNNMADSYNRAGKIDDAVKTYELAAQTDPTSAAQSYFNIGAVLTNAGKADEANAAFEKCIAADPCRASAPRATMFSPEAASLVISTRRSRREVYSTITTASASAGTGAPVMMETAWPGST